MSVRCPIASLWSCRAIVELKHALEENGVARGPLLNNKYDKDDVSCCRWCQRLWTPFSVMYCTEGFIAAAAIAIIPSSPSEYWGATEFCSLATIEGDAGNIRGRCRTIGDRSVWEWICLFNLKYRTSFSSRKLSPNYKVKICPVNVGTHMHTQCSTGQ